MKKTLNIGSPLLLAARNGHIIQSMAKDNDGIAVIREAVQNGIEARAKHIHIHPEFFNVRQSIAKGKRVDKMVIRDDGCGMSPQELPTYIRSIGASSKVTSEVDNFGTGLKWLALANNPIGLDVISYQNGKGYMISVIEENGGYGLANFKGFDEDGEEVITDIIEVPADMHTEYGTHPETGLPLEHGTIYIFHGSSEEESTFPIKGSTPTRMQAYLNERYFKIPAGVTIHLCIPANEDVSKWPITFKDSRNRPKDHTQHRTVLGHQRYLDKYSKHHSSTRISGGTMHWWVFGNEKNLIKDASGKLMKDPSDPKGRKNIGDEHDINAHKYNRNGYHATRGLTGVLYQDEVYDPSRDARRFFSCGIFSSDTRARLVLMFEPDAGTVQPNQSRSRMMWSNPIGKPEVSMWEVWASEFSKKLPPEIQQLISESHVDIEDKGFDQWIADKMTSMTAMLDIIPNFKNPSTDVNLLGAGDGTEGTDGEPNDTVLVPGPGNNPGPGKGGGGGDGHNGGDPKTKDVGSEGTGGSPKVRKPKFPPCEVVDGASEVSAILHDGVGVAISKLVIYSQSPRFLFYKNLLLKEWEGFADPEEVEKAVFAAVVRVFKFQLLQRVVVAKTMRKIGCYTNTDRYNKLVGSEALDASLCGILSLHDEMNNILHGGTLGRMRSQAKKASLILQAVDAEEDKVA